MALQKDLTGQRFGRLLALRVLRVDEYASSDTKTRQAIRYWVICDCGTIKLVRSDVLLRGCTVSCGCYAAERSSERNTKHGQCGTPEYRSWSAMLSRCQPLTRGGKLRYGGRGIKVCAQWAKSFDTFLADVGKRPSLTHTLGRINNDGNYEPGNVRWEIPSQQARNRSSNVVLTFQGESLVVRDWATRLGMPFGTLYSRLYSGWPVERILSRERFKRQSKQ